MDSNEQSFRDNFETLLTLFRKLADKIEEGGITGTNPQFAEQFRLMLNQYEMMRHMMPDDIPEKFREPFRQMMENMIAQLKREMGEEIVPADEKPVVKKKSVNHNQPSVREIEDMLRQPGLDPDEIDKLLDRLAELKSQKG